MNIDQKRPIYVVGHKNPDTDSICSAIAYANLKNRLSGEEQHYIAGRAGAMNQETEFVLKRFQVETPLYISHVGTQVSDMDIRKTEGIPGDMSIKRAWELMRDLAVTTLAITEEQKLKGLITVVDISKAYMDSTDCEMLSETKTSYRNILDTLDATMIVGNAEGAFEEGNVVIATASPELMEEYVHEGDLVVVGNRYETQLCAIEMGAKCLVICLGSKVSQTIKKLANERGCNIILTPHDTYSVARLLGQSMPVSYFMKSDRFAKNLVTFHINDSTEDVRDIMGSKRYRYFPILDKDENYVGMISRRNLLNVKKKQLILVDHNEESQAVDGIGHAEVLEILDHHRVSLETTAPVYIRNEPVGCTATIVYRMYRENQIEIDETIAGLLCSAILSDTLMFRSPTCTVQDRMAAENLAEIAKINIEEHAKEMFAAGSALGDKQPQDIFYQDFKRFTAAGICFGVGQISSMNAEELEEIKRRLLPYMEEAKTDMDVIFFMLTDIMKESTELLFYGKRARQTLEDAFFLRTEDVKDDQSCILRNVVSRKKQLIPAIVGSLQR